LDKIETIDNETKYRQMQAIYRQVSPQYLSTFIQKAYEIATENWKYQLLIDFSIPDPDMDLIKRWFRENKNFNYVVISHLTSQYQMSFANYYLEEIQILDSEPKYQEFKKIYSNLTPENAFKFIQKAYELATDEWKYQLWLDGYIKEIDIPYLIHKLTTITDFSYYSNPFQQIFKNLNHEQQLYVSTAFLDKIETIDNETKYRQMQAIYRQVSPQYLSTFIQKAYEIATEKWKYQLLIDFPIPDPDMDLIEKWFIEKMDFNYTIISHLSSEQQNSFINFYLWESQQFGNETNYQKIKQIYQRLSSENNKTFIQKAYEIANEALKKAILFNFFDILTNISQTQKWLLLMDILLQKPKKNKYYNVPLIDLMRYDVPYIKNEINVFDNPVLSIIQHDLYRLGTQRLLPSKQYERILQFVSTGLAKIDFEDFLSQIDLDSQIYTIINLREISKYVNSPYNENFFVKHAIRLVSSVEEKIEDYLQKDHLLAEILILIYKIDKQVYQNFADKYSNQFSTYIKMKLWVHDVYDVFDYNNYGFYYFRLNKYEKKRYNQKAREIMKEEIKRMMIAERIPWKYLYTDNENNNYYEASWKSIWFLNHQIKFCMNDENEEHSFSKPYKWDYAEEKFNFLFGYLSKKKIENLQVQEKDGQILYVKGIEALEEHIYKANIEKQIKDHGIEKVIKEEGTNKIPP
ncbi:MAG: hypothetical protein NZM44_01455, partial [Candidatus Calescibacterium sp.]|nr:hypothetical protein [Candidatus Calescibacterium sp.]